VTLRCDGCGWTGPLPADWLDVAFEFWAAHGHYPASATFLCPCGASHRTGTASLKRGEWLDAQRGGAWRVRAVMDRLRENDETFLRAHAHHLEEAAGVH